MNIDLKHTIASALFGFEENIKKQAKVYLSPFWENRRIDEENSNSNDSCSNHHTQNEVTFQEKILYTKSVSFT